MQTSAFLQQKTSIFRHLWCVCMDNGGWASANILQTRGVSVNFSQYCADVFYGRPRICYIQ